MSVSIDWAALATEEWDRNNENRETRTASGIHIAQFTTGAKLRAWVKFAGEPAERLYETPAAFGARWLAFKNNPDQECVVFHEHEFGQMVLIFRSGIEHLWKVGATYPDASQGRTTPGSIWAGECRCAAYGGPCPPIQST